MDWLLLLSVIIGLPYLITLLIIRYGTVKKDDLILLKEIPGHKLSVIIAARNEEENIEKVLSDLVHQSLENDLFEVILVNDHSSDGTVEKAKIFDGRLSLKIISLNEKSGKKAAMKAGTDAAIGEILVFTDADVRLHPDWLITLGQYFEAENDWVSGLVKNDMKGSILSIFQAYDQASLMAITHASFSLNQPGLASGANLALRKEAFDTIKGFEWPAVRISGDDVLLLERMAEEGRYKIGFASSKEAIVSTSAAPSWTSFLKQRKRWASNSLKLKNNFIKWVMTIGFLANLWLLFLLVHAVFNVNSIYQLTSFFLLKALFEGVTIYPTLRSMDQNRYFILRFPIVALLHPIYILTAGILGIFAPNRWKGRVT